MSRAGFVAFKKNGVEIVGKARPCLCSAALLTCIPNICPTSCLVAYGDVELPNNEGEHHNTASLQSFHAQSIKSLLFV